MRPLIKRRWTSGIGIELNAGQRSEGLNNRIGVTAGQDHFGGGERFSDGWENYPRQSFSRRHIGPVSKMSDK